MAEVAALERSIMMQPKELDLLKRLAGEWDMDITVRMPDGSMMGGRGVMAAEEIARGNGVHTRLTYDIGSGPIEEDDLWSFDRGSGKVHVFSVTSDQNVHDHIGGWKDDDTLEIRWEDPIGGRDTVEEMTVSWQTPDQIRINDTMFEDGKATVMSDLMATRRR